MKKGSAPLLYLRGVALRSEKQSALTKIGTHSKISMSSRANSVGVVYHELPIMRGADVLRELVYLVINARKIGRYELVFGVDEESVHLHGDNVV